MCGIAGLVYADTTRPVDRLMLRSMTQTLIHRGPDGEGFFTHPGVGLGIRRLSIIDLETGDQPITNESETVTVVCNGEIYNFVELRQELIGRGHRFRTQTDVEVIVHLFEEHGIGCLEHLRGMFALAIWDDREKALFVARDRFGIKPIYIAENHDALLFGSEQKAILASGLVERKLGWQGMRDLLSMGFIQAPATMFASIRQLPPGTYLKYSQGQSVQVRYWNIAFPRRGEDDRSLSSSEWAERLREALDESVRLHMRSDVQVGSWMSPGLDSSAIVALMARHTSDPICTTTLSFEDPAYDEVRGQRSLLDHPAIPVRSRIPLYTPADLKRYPASVWHAESPTCTGIEVVRDILGEASSQDVKVVLTGEGSDEIFAGYKRFRLDKLLRPLARLPIPLRRAMLLGDAFPKRWPRASEMLIAPRQTRFDRYASTLGQPQARGVDRVLSGEAKRSLLKRSGAWDLDLPPDFDRWHPLSQMQYYELKIRLPSLVVHSLDRGSMAHSVEARVPFLDHKLFELVAQIPPSLRLKRLTEKHILREAVRPILPSEIVDRPKVGLRSPIHSWFRDPLPGVLEDLLTEKALRRTGIFNPSEVAALRAEHRQGSWIWAAELTAVMSVQVWDALFVRQETDLI